MAWVIAFIDVDEEYWCEEILDDKGDFSHYGCVKKFDTREQAEKFRIENCDSQAYDFYVKPLSLSQIEKYEEEREVNPK